ncbi:3641_t:CDS:1, partial [Acaulospora colombiana]
MAQKKLSELTPLEVKGDSTKPALIVALPVITVREALKIMGKNNITSLPIYSHNSENIVNIVNLVDVLNYVIKEVASGEMLPYHLESERSRQLDDSIESVMTLDDERESYRIFKSDANESLKD